MTRNSEFDEALNQLGEVLAKPYVRPMAEGEETLPSPSELYGGMIYEHRSGLRVIPHGAQASEPVSKLYRVAHPAEWAQAQSQGYLQAQSGGEGYTRASAAPDERWRYQGRRGEGPGVRPERGVTLEIDYHPEDRWRASAEGYAATKARIPLHRVRQL